jgi:hypothetical protein
MTGQVIVGAASTTPSTTTPTPNNATTTPNNATTTPNNATTTPNNATVPEFGPVASIVLAIAVMSMVVFVAKTRGIPKF